MRVRACVRLSVSRYVMDGGGYSRYVMDGVVTTVT
jgi:hypothetical protein